MTLENLYRERDKIINAIVDQMDFETNYSLADLFFTAVDKVIPDKKNGLDLNS